MSTLGDIGEAAFIDRLRARIAEGDGVLCGLGDDAAVLDAGAGQALIVTVDSMVSGSHFYADSVPWRLFGRKALASSASDIVAMNARPRYAVVALGAPADTRVADMDRFYEGLESRARELGLIIVGGDTTRSDLLTVSVTVIGHADQEDVVLRSGAQPGDLLCVTGPLGASHAGLQLFLIGDEVMSPACLPAMQAHWDPPVRLDVIDEWLHHGFRPHALTDISDGLATEVYNICQASGCGAILRPRAVPVSPIARTIARKLREDASEYALFWGEDYELVFAAPKSAISGLDRASYKVIGHCTTETPVLLKGRRGPTSPLPRKGWQHFDEKLPPLD